jgi:mRNA interferase MazF
MTPFEFGDVVLVSFPFTDQSTTKQRPAVVISSAAYNRDRPDALILAISSRGRSGGTIEEPSIVGWQEAGLLLPSFLKPLIATIECPILRRRLGRLRPDDQQTLRRLLDAIIGGPNPTTGSRRRGASA